MDIESNKKLYKDLISICILLTVLTWAIMCFIPIADHMQIISYVQIVNLCYLALSLLAIALLLAVWAMLGKYDVVYAELKHTELALKLVLSDSFNDTIKQLEQKLNQEDETPGKKQIQNYMVQQKFNANFSIPSILNIENDDINEKENDD